MLVADFCSVPRSTESFSKSNHQTGFLFPAAIRSDIKGKRELSTALGKCWVTLWAHPHQSLLCKEGLSGEGGAEAGVIERASSHQCVCGPQQCCEQNSFSSHNLTLAMTQEILFFFLLLLLYVPASCSSPFPTLLLGSQSQPRSCAGPAQQQGRSSSCQGLLEDAAMSGFKPPSSLPSPHTTFSFYFWEAGISQDRDCSCVGEKKPVTPQQFMDNFPLIRDNGV